MANRWYVKLGGEELGPLSDAGLRRFLESDQAGKGALVRNGRDGPWLPASQCDAVRIAQGGAAAVVVAAAPASAPDGRTANGANPIEGIPNASGQRPFRSRPVVLLAAGMGFTVLLSAACIGAWLLARHFNAQRRIAAAPPPANAAPQSPSVGELENETKRLRQELDDLQHRLRDREQPPADANPAPPADDVGDEQAAKERKQRIERLQSQIREAVAALDVDLASEKLKQSLPLVDGEEHDRAMNLLGQLDGARLEKLLQYVRAMPEDAQQALADKRPAPADLMRQFNDRDLIGALQTQLPHLAALAIAEAEDKAWQELGEEALRRGDLTTLRRWAFLQQAFSSKLEGRLTQDRVAALVDTFGVFGLQGEPSLVGGLLTAPAEAELAFRNGVELQVALTDLYAECRKLAGDEWPPDERPHPLAGHWAWTGVSPYEVYVNPASDEITFALPDQETFVQRICKIGPDYLVAYELRWRLDGSSELPDRRLTEVIPFGSVMEPESETNLDPLLPYSDFGPNVYFVLTLYRRSGKAAKKLAVSRTEMQGEALSKETLLAPDGGFWNKLGIAAEYHREQAGFRRVNDKLKP